eukprot:1137576-Pelagomonas_calceolata.AAC.2
MGRLQEVWCCTASARSGVALLELVMVLHCQCQVWCCNASARSGVATPVLSLVLHCQCQVWCCNAGARSGVAMLVPAGVILGIRWKLLACVEPACPLKRVFWWLLVLEHVGEREKDGRHRMCLHLSHRVKQHLLPNLVPDHKTLIPTSLRPDIFKPVPSNCLHAGTEASHTVQSALTMPCIHPNLQED